jgi:cysteine desulfurase
VAVLEPCRHLQARGFEVTILPVDGDGRVAPEAVRQALTPHAMLISVMHANNETGVIQPVADIAAIAREVGARLHTDAAQSVGKIKVDVQELQVDFLTVAGHKFYAPKGVGALYVRQGAAFTPLLHGASQERGLRAGTEDAPHIVALGEACRLAQARLEADAIHLKAMRDRLQELLQAGFPRLVVHGGNAPRLPNTLYVSFPGLSGAEIMAGLPQMAASLGAACHGDHASISHVLAAMQVTPEVARGAIRFTVGRPTTAPEVERAAALVLARIKALSSR